MARHSASQRHWRASTRRYVEKHAATEARYSDESRDKLRLHQQLAMTIERLEPMYRDVLVMRYLEEQPPREIAKKLGLPASTEPINANRCTPARSGGKQSRAGCSAQPNRFEESSQFGSGRPRRHASSTARHR